MISESTCRVWIPTNHDDSNEFGQIHKRKSKPGKTTLIGPLGSRLRPENRHSRHNPQLFALGGTIETSPTARITDTPEDRSACANLDRAVPSRGTRSESGFDDWFRCFGAAGSLAIRSTDETGRPEGLMTMTGRSVCLIAVILLSVGASRSEAQTYGPQGQPVFWPSGSMQQPGSWTPITPHYTPGPANWVQEDITADRGGLYEDTPLDEFIKDVTRDAFFRVEWLSWGYKKPGGQPLGAPILSTTDPREPFDITVAGTNFGDGHVETLRGIQADQVSGIRGTIGLPLAMGDVEASIFYFENFSDGTLVDGRDGIGFEAVSGDPTTVQFVATTTLTNGQIGNNAFLYDDSFSTHYKTQLWGSDINYVFDAALSEPYIQIRPMFGFRYLAIDDHLDQIGVFDGQGQLTPAQIVRSLISSDSENNVYIPQIGMRVEATSRWLTIGLQPKFGMGVNQYRGTVFTESLRSVGDPHTQTTESGEKLSVSGELAVYGKLHISKHVSLNVGYTFLFVDNITRAHNSILYNDNGQNADPAVVSNPAFDLMYYQGLNVGGEIRY